MASGFRRNDGGGATHGAKSNGGTTHPAPPAATSAAPAPLMLEPSNAFEALLHQQMLTVEQQLKDLRGSLNHLFLLVVGTVALQAVLRVAGF